MTASVNTCTHVLQRLFCTRLSMVYQGWLYALTRSQHASKFYYAIVQLVSYYVRPKLHSVACFSVKTSSKSNVQCRSKRQSEKGMVKLGLLRSKQTSRRRSAAGQLPQAVSRKCLRADAESTVSMQRSQCFASPHTARLLFSCNTRCRQILVMHVLRSILHQTSKTLLYAAYSGRVVLLRHVLQCPDWT